MTSLSTTRLSFSAALALALGLGLAPGAAAQGEGAHFRAQLAAAPAEARAIAGGVVWRCTDTACVAPRSNARPLRTCRELRQELGPVVSFAAGGVALTPEELARCNG